MPIHVFRTLERCTCRKLEIEWNYSPRNYQSPVPLWYLVAIKCFVYCVWATATAQCCSFDVITTRFEISGICLTEIPRCCLDENLIVGTLWRASRMIQPQWKHLHYQVVSHAAGCLQWPLKEHVHCHVSRHAVKNDVYLYSHTVGVYTI